MFGLDGPADIAPSNVFCRPLGLKTGPPLVQQVGQAGDQGPEAYDGGLIMIATQQVLTVFEEGLDVPAHSQHGHHLLGIGVEQSVVPVAGLIQGRGKAFADDQH